MYCELQVYGAKDVVEDIQSYMTADVWSAQVVPVSGQSDVEPLVYFNTVPLFEEIGRSFGVGCIRTPRYVIDEQMAKSLADDSSCFLEHFNNGKKLLLFCGGGPTHFRVVVFEKLRIDGDYYATYSMEDSLFKPSWKLTNTTL